MPWLHFMMSGHLLFRTAPFVWLVDLLAIVGFEFRSYLLSRYITICAMPPALSKHFLTILNRSISVFQCINLTQAPVPIIYFPYHMLSSAEFLIIASPPAFRKLRSPLNIILSFYCSSSF
jgi:hypothetical protein